MNRSAHWQQALALIIAVAITAACGGSTANEPVTAEKTEPVEAAEAAPETSEATGIRLVSAQAGADMQANPPEDLVILDVRTPEEFDEARLEGALMIDFYEDDFAEQLAGLDPTVPYLLYCRSGNRSGQTAEMMRQLGFADVADVDGGINAWNAAGLPTVNG